MSCEIAKVLNIIIYYISKSIILFLLFSMLLLS
nr:MAG TPA: hypothetical protein [Bacteriophage sp.]